MTFLYLCWTNLARLWHWSSARSTWRIWLCRSPYSAERGNATSRASASSRCLRLVKALRVLFNCFAAVVFPTLRWMRLISPLARAWSQASNIWLSLAYVQTSSPCLFLQRYVWSCNVMFDLAITSIFLDPAKSDVERGMELHRKYLFFLRRCWYLWFWVGFFVGSSQQPTFFHPTLPIHIIKLGPTTEWTCYETAPGIDLCFMRTIFSYTLTPIRTDCFVTLYIGWSFFHDVRLCAGSEFLILFNGVCLQFLQQRS